MRFPSGALLVSLLVGALATMSVADDGRVIRPEGPMALFNGRDLSGFDPWLVDTHDRDPDRVFSVVDQIDDGPAIRVSGQHFGGLATHDRYADYRLVVEFRWGLLTWGRRTDRARDSGVLVHGQGTLGNTRADMNGPWLRSIEAQIIEGGVGDFILVNGFDPDGTAVTPTVSATAATDRDGEPVYASGAAPREFTSGRINWFGRDPDWTDRLGYRGPNDVESPAGQWTRMEVTCRGRDITVRVNGTVVNAATNASISDGRIMFQSEGAEIFFRKIELLPLDGPDTP